MGAVTWAFEFEDQPYFDGFRDLATNGVDKPVLNVFRMLGMMTGNRLKVENPGAATLDAMLAGGVKDRPDIHAMAAPTIASARSWSPITTIPERTVPTAAVRLTIAGVPAGRQLVEALPRGPAAQ